MLIFVGTTVTALEPHRALPVVAAPRSHPGPVRPPFSGPGRGCRRQRDTRAHAGQYTGTAQDERCKDAQALTTQPTSSLQPNLPTTVQRLQRLPSNRPTPAPAQRRWLQPSSSAAGLGESADADQHHDVRNFLTPKRMDEGGEKGAEFVCEQPMMASAAQNRLRELNGAHPLPPSSHGPIQRCSCSGCAGQLVASAQ